MKVRLTGRPEAEFYKVLDELDSGIVKLQSHQDHRVIRVPKEWVIDESTPVIEWDRGDCGVDASGRQWVRLFDGAVRMHGGELVVYSAEELRDDRARYSAVKDPELKFTGTWGKK